MKSIVRDLKGAAKWKENGMSNIPRNSVYELWSERTVVTMSCHWLENSVLNCSLLYKWRHRLDPANGQAQGEATVRNSRESTLRKEVDKLKRLLANKTVEVDFFRCALQKVEARRRNSGISGGQASTAQSETSLQGSLSVERMCQLGQVSRAGFYRYFQTRAPIEESMTVGSAIQEIAWSIGGATAIGGSQRSAGKSWEQRSRPHGIRREREPRQMDGNANYQELTKYSGPALRCATI